MSSAEVLVLALVIAITTIGVGVGAWWGVSARRRLRRGLIVESLRPDQRRQVIRAVRRGKSVSDPALCPAAAELAQTLATRPEHTLYRGMGRGSRWRYVFAAFCAIAVVSQLIGHHWAEAGLWGYIGYFVPFGQYQALDHQRRKFERSLVANQI